MQSAGRSKVFFHPYQSLLHDHHPLAGLSDFVAAGSGESQAQAGRGGIGFRGDTVKVGFVQWVLPSPNLTQRMKIRME